MDTSPPHHELSTEKPDTGSSDAQSLTNDDGTLAQARLGVRPARGHFFSALDALVAEAVKNDAQHVVYSELEERAVKRKIDIRILPLVVSRSMFVREVMDSLPDNSDLSFLNNLKLINLTARTCHITTLHAKYKLTFFTFYKNSGNAHVLSAFNRNFGIHSNNRWTLALSIFYMGYCLLEIPANVLQRRIGANRFFFMAMLFWGLSSLSIVYSRGYGALLVLRVLLGIGEAGYYAGIIYYLSFWYRRKEMAFRISLSMTGTLPGAIGGLLAFGLVRAKTSHLDGWQFLFLIESIPTIIIAFLLLFFLPSFPFTSTFLSPREKAIAQARLDRDHRPTSHGGMNGWQGLKAILCDINVWLLMLIYVGFNIGTATSTYFLPTLIKQLGFSAIETQGLTVAPYVFGYAFTISQAFHSDRTHDRGWHVMFSTAVSCIGYIILATCAEKSIGASYFALFLVIGGNFSLFPLVMSWAANTLSPTSKRGVGTAFIVSISNCVSIAAPQIYFDPEDRFRRGHGIAAGCLFMSFSVAFILRTRLSMLNGQKKSQLASLNEQKDSRSEEFADSDPRFTYMT